MYNNKIKQKAKKEEEKFKILNRWQKHWTTMQSEAKQNTNYTGIISVVTECPSVTRTRWRNNAMHETFMGTKQKRRVIATDCSSAIQTHGELIKIRWHIHGNKTEEKICSHWLLFCNSNTQRINASAWNIHGNNLNKTEEKTLHVKTEWTWQNKLSCVVFEMHTHTHRNNKHPSNTRNQCIRKMHTYTYIKTTNT